MQTNTILRVWQVLICGIAILSGSISLAQTLPYEFSNNSDYADDQIFVAIVGITDGHVWVDPTNGQVHPMSQSDNTVPGPVIGGNQGPGNNGMYANCFRRLSEIPNRVVNIPKIAGCRIMISFESQLYLYFFGHSGDPSGYSAPNLANPTDPNQGIKFELVELTFNDFGLWCNTTRVDSYQYPMGLEVWGSGFYKRVGELKTHGEILGEWQATAPSEFQGLLNSGEGIIHFPTKSSTFPQSLIQNYIDQIWSKYSSQQLVFNSGDAGTWRGGVSGNNMVLTRDSDGQVATIPGKPTTLEAMEASGVMASGAQWDLVVQAQIAAAINRHAINLNLGSGAMQDFGNPATYYQTWPYNWYAKFWHRTDISQDGQTYAFSFDDVFDQSATIHTPSPTNIKITVGGFAGTVNPEPGVATFYQHCSYGGYSASLPIGNYTMSDLAARGLQNDDISSLQIDNGYQAVLFWDNNYTGSSITLTGNNDCLVDEGWNDQITSLQVSTVSNNDPVVTNLSGEYFIQNRKSGLYIDVADWGTQDGANLLQWHYHGGNNQKFEFIHHGSGVYTIRSVHSNKVMDVAGVSSANGANIHQWTDVGGANQRWRVTDVGGYVQLTATHSDKVAEIINGSVDPAASVQQYDNNGQVTSHWTLVPVGAPSWSTQIEAENQAASSDVTPEPCSEGGENLGWIDTGDWMVWDINLPANADYNVEYRVASPNSGGMIQLEMAGGSPVYGTIGVPNTGGWQSWTTISHCVNLTAGAQQIAIYVPAGGWNINWLRFTQLTNGRAGEETAETLLSATKIKLYPNPAIDHLTIEGFPEGSPIAIYDLGGRPVYQGSIDTSNSKAQLDISNLKQGYYFLLDLSGGKTLRFKKQ